MSVKSNIDDVNQILGSGDEYENFTKYQYFLNIIKNTDVKSALAYRVCSAFEAAKGEIENIKKFPTKPAAGKDKSSYPNFNKPSANSVEPADWELLKNYFEKKLSDFATVPEKTLPFKNIEKIAQSLHLSEVEHAILEIVYLSQNYDFKRIPENIISDDKSKLPAMISLLLDNKYSMRQISNVMTPQSSLIKYGLFEVMEDDEDIVFPVLSYDLKEYINNAGDGSKDFFEDMIGRPLTANLTCADYPFIADDLEQIKKIIAHAKEKNISGVNILLAGPAGSGKTDLAKAIAGDLGFTLFAIGENDEREKEYKIKQSSAQFRMGKLFQANEFLKDNKTAILLFDEVEDLLLKGTDSDKKADTFSKILINRILEQNPVVTIWAGNDPEKFHESMRQRFTYTVHVGYPPTLIRKKVWEKQVNINGITTLTEADILYLAREYRAPPRMISKALQTTAMYGEPTVANIERIMEASSSITYGDSHAIKSNAGVSKFFDVSLFNYDNAHQNEIKSILSDGVNTKPYSLFFQGASGVGMRSMARFMAENAVLDHAEYDVHALLAPNPFVSPAAKIMGAFKDAAHSRNLLVFSNIDAFVDDAKGDDKMWKDSLAPLFAECAMDHNLPFIAYTHKPENEFPDFMQDIFSLRSHVSPLSQEQSVSAYNIYFGRNAENTIFSTMLTPSDFAKVAKITKKNLNGNTPDDRIVDLLNRQSEVRQESQNAIGFGKR